LCQYYVHYLALASGWPAAEGQTTERVHPLMEEVSKYFAVDAGPTQAAVVHREDGGVEIRRRKGVVHQMKV
jgi:hypothetical protein